MPARLAVGKGIARWSGVERTKGAGELMRLTVSLHQRVKKGVLGLLDQFVTHAEGKCFEFISVIT